MNRPITISVVTPSYNQGRFLGKTIESVIGQEGDFHLDYFVADGGSTDGSVETIRHYARLVESGEWDARCLGVNFRWISEKDAGQADAIVKGFNRAEGDVLAWLNSDDTLLPGALSGVADVFAAGQDLSVVYGKARYIDSEGKTVGDYPTAPFDFRRLATFNFLCQPATFFTKNAYASAGGLDVRLHYVMDYDLWVRLVKTGKFHYLKEYLATYRLHGESKTVSERHALANHEEALQVARKYYDWAPLSRVYVCCRSRVSRAFPAFLNKLGFPVTLSALAYGAVRYLFLNKGIRGEDLKQLNIEKLWRIFGSRPNGFG